jgi:1-deoxy-D-xylulose-5-phosphate reductoisomerase
MMNSGNKKKKIIILGSTGSIGLSTLNIVKNNPDLFEISGISFHSNTESALVQIKEFTPQFVSVTGMGKDVLPEDFNSLGSTRYFFGSNGLKEMLEQSDADIVVNGIAGSSGFLPSLWAIEAGKDLALANKETIVMAGPLIMAKAQEMNVNIIPVDSEHSAVFFLLKNIERKNIKEIILTASGGAFRDYPLEKLSSVTPADALKHPTWNMGNKITIDSATMANKGLEIIEAKYLFNVDKNKIKVLIHPQSYVHSLVRTKDNCLYAQISNPDMRIPIKNALTFPEIIENSLEHLTLAGKQLNFLEWDRKKYPMLALAYDCLGKDGAYPVVYNASNEVAVNAFMNNQISFMEIYKYVNKMLELNWKIEVNSVDCILHIDTEARKKINYAISK